MASLLPISKKFLSFSPRIFKSVSTCTECGKITKINITRHYSITGAKAEKDISERVLGQPTAQTHPKLLNKDEVTPGLTKKDYLLRRISLMNSICSEKLDLSNPEKAKWHATETSSKEEHVIILLGSPTMYMSQDIPYVFHQNTNFLYLTGFLEPDSCLILETIPGRPHPEHRSILFVPKRDPIKELWNGARSGVDGALYHTGVDHTEEIDNLGAALSTYLTDKYTIWYDYNKMVNLPLHMKIMGPFLTEATKLNRKIRTIEEPLNEKRVIKSEQEVMLMAMASEITAAAFKETMSMCYTGMNESAINARLEYAVKVRGAQMLAYPPVVASGNRANTLHYVSNNQVVEDGTLVLADAGALYHGYVSDVTRTWPINGKFSEVQRQLYEAILRIQSHCIEMCLPGENLDNIYNVMTMLLAQELYSIGVIKKMKPVEMIDAVRKFCPHHVGHWLGMDVHDTSGVRRNIPLKPGMVVTIEPGVYLQEDDDTIPERFRGIGIRVEDDVLITKEKPHVLTQSCPKSVERIEHIMKR